VRVDARPCDYVPLVRALSVWLAVGTSCWGYPRIDVNPVFARDGALGLSFEKCTWPRSAGVSRLEIRRNTEPEGPWFYGSQSLCGLESNERGKPRRLAKWTSGEPTEGFTIIGQCPPLKPGTYRIVVEGTGGGSRVFGVADGRVTEKSPGCGS
jgi:hypothetical protein